MFQAIEDLFQLSIEEIKEYEYYVREIVAQCSYLEFYDKLNKREEEKLAMVVDTTKDIKEWYEQLMEVFQKELKRKAFKKDFRVPQLLTDYLSKKLQAVEVLEEIFNVGKTKTIIRIPHRDINKVPSVTHSQISFWAHGTIYLRVIDHYWDGIGQKYIFHRFSLLQHLKNNERLLHELGIGLSELDFINLAASTLITEESKPELFYLIQLPFYNYVHTDFDSIKSLNPGQEKT